MRIMVIALLLAGCVTDKTALSIEPGRWANYHDLKVGAMKLALADQSAPESVKDAFANCAADYTDKFMTPEETMYLNAYARGDQEVTIGEMKSMDAAINARSGINGPITSANVGLLSAQCPADVPSFRQYLKL